VLVIVLVTGPAVAGSPEPGELAATVRTGSPGARRAAAAQLGSQVVEKRSAAEIFAARLSMSDDAKVRGPLLEGLVDAGWLRPSAAKRVPSRSQLAARLRKLGRGFTPDECTLQLRADRDEAMIECTHLVEARCLFDTIDSTTVTIGGSWTIAPVKRGERPNELCDF